MKRLCLVVVTALTGCINVQDWKSDEPVSEVDGFGTLLPWTPDFVIKTDGRDGVAYYSLDSYKQVIDKVEPRVEPLLERASADEASMWESYATTPVVMGTCMVLPISCGVSLAMAFLPVGIGAYFGGQVDAEHQIAKEQFNDALRSHTALTANTLSAK